MNEVLPWLMAAALAGYVAGTLPSALLLGRALRGVDLRERGSGNLGAANVQAVPGNAVGLAVLALDAGKGALAAAAAPPALLAAGAAGTDPDLVAAVAAGGAVVGHCFPVWLRFRGGKGVAPYLGALLVLDPLVALVAVAGFTAVVLATRYVAPGSLALAVAGAVLLAVRDAPRPHVVFALLATVLIHILHRSNLDRLRRGKEPPLF